MRIRAILTLLATLCLAASTVIAESTTRPTTEQWGVFDASLPGPSTGNPFIDVDVSAKFSHEDTTVNVKGFYDGQGVYRVRFMPGALGDWRYVTQSNAPQLNGVAGSFNCIKATGANHGPVQV